MWLDSKAWVTLAMHQRIWVACGKAKEEQSTPLARWQEMVRVEKGTKDSTGKAKEEENSPLAHWKEKVRVKGRAGYPQVKVKEKEKVKEAKVYTLRKEKPRDQGVGTTDNTDT